MKKNGFTLIELLAVIIILGLISLIVFPAVDKTIKNQKEKLYDRQVATILDAAESWGLKNIDKLPMDEQEKEYVNISALISEGFLKNSDIKDPRNDELMIGCVEIVYDDAFQQYKYSYIDENESMYGEKCL